MSVDPPRRRWKRRLAALGLSLVVSLALGELAVRSVVGAPLAERLPILMMRANPQRGWEMVPGKEHYTYQHLVHVNALGLRGPELGEKQPLERRVLALGDSLVYGQGVADGETLPVALESALRRLDPQHAWTVVNAGHRAYDTRQELALLEELGERIQPDVVLLCWYWNDLNERNIERTYANLEHKGEVSFDTGNSVEGFDRLRWRAQQLVRKSALFMLVHDILSSRAEPMSPEYVQKGLQRLGRYLERFRALAQRFGSTPVFVVIPDPNVLRGRKETQGMADRAAGLARERNLPVIELLSALEPLLAEDPRVPIVPFDGHYDPRANRAMGEFLAARLLPHAKD